MVQALYYIKVSLINSMVLESMEDWLKLHGVKSFLIVQLCKAQWDVILVCFFLEFIDNMEMVNH